MPDSATVISPAEVLRKALVLFGPDGEHWSQSISSASDPEATCAILSINAALEEGPRMFGLFTKVGQILKKAIGDVNIIKWNDDPKRTWPEVKQAFEEAIQLAEREEHVSQSLT